jgi:hypothetical protein
MHISRQQDSLIAGVLLKTPFLLMAKHYNHNPDFELPHTSVAKFQITCMYTTVLRKLTHSRFGQTASAG